MILRPTGIQIATKSYATIQAMAPTIQDEQCQCVCGERRKIFMNLHRIGTQIIVVDENRGEIGRPFLAAAAAVEGITLLAVSVVVTTPMKSYYVLYINLFPPAEILPDIIHMAHNNIILICRSTYYGR